MKLHSTLKQNSNSVNNTCASYTKNIEIETM